MLHELWFALRRIRRRPLHALSVALTLGLGIGSAITVLGAADAVLLRPLPFPRADRLVRVTQTLPVDGLPELNVSDVLLRRVTEDNRTLDGVAAWVTRNANLLHEGGSAERLVVARVSASLFTVLGIRPVIGRAFAPDEDLPDGQRVVVLTHRFWRSAFNADSAVVGAVIRLESVPYTVIGVLGPKVVFPSREVAVWEPLQLSPSAVNPYQNAYSIVARLRPGATHAAARNDVTGTIRSVGREFPGPHPGSALDPAGYQANVRPLATAVAGDARPVVALLLAGVVALLLLTGANVANLQLAVVVGRIGELSLRTALGATRRRLIVGQVLEATVLAVAGAMLGLIVSLTGARLVASLLPASLALERAGPGAPALVVTVILVLLVGIGVGALPIVMVTRRAPTAALRDRIGETLGAARVRRILASAQVALAVILLHGAGLLLVSAGGIAQVELGFQPDGAVGMRLNIPDATLRDRGARETLLRRILGEIAAVPGVTATGIANGLPLTLGPRDVAMAVEGRPFKADGTDPVADARIVSEGYFAAMGIRVVRGRLFGDDEATDRFTPLVISEGLARRLFPTGEDPIGQRLRFGPVAPWMPIVGVVQDARNRSITESPRPELYSPALGSYASLALRSGLSIVVRAPNRLELAGSLRRIVERVAPDVAVERIVPIREVVRESGARMTTATKLIAWYAATALLIAIAGTYAVLSFLIAQRRGELAVRVALGASPRAIVGLVARESASLVGVGAFAGLAGAVASARLLQGLLYGVGTFDARVLAAVAAIAAAGALAAVAPVRRALGADPCDALRGGP